MIRRFAKLSSSPFLSFSGTKTTTTTRTMPIRMPTTTTNAITILLLLVSLYGTTILTLPTLAWVNPSSTRSHSSRRLYLAGMKSTTQPVPTVATSSSSSSSSLWAHPVDAVASAGPIITPNNINNKSSSAGVSSSSFLGTDFFALSECDNSNTPPSLNVILRSLQYLFGKTNKSDLRGRYVSHPTHGTMLAVVHALKQGAQVDDQPLLTPFAAYCIGHALGQVVMQQQPHENNNNNSMDDQTKKKNSATPRKATLAIGRDPRRHGTALADALARGATAAGLHVVDLGLATTPACAAYPYAHPGALAVMVTASHLPRDRNGFKIFGLPNNNNNNLQVLLEPAQQCATTWYNHGILPLYNEHAVTCHESDPSLDYYRAALRGAMTTPTTTTTTMGGSSSSTTTSSSLAGLKIVLNTGNGSGGFFAQVLREFGADVSGSIYLEPNGDFPHGIPNPEDPAMLQATIQAMEAAQADLGIMLDTDADRCGFVVPTSASTGAGNQHDDVDDHSNNNNKKQAYTALNRNRLIALLGVVLSHEYPGCTVVTDSVTSEGLTTFLQDTLGLHHVRYLKGYANVIGKARELTESGQYQAELAIETSGHCAMREHQYIDDGTYTAMKVCNLLARGSGGRSSNNLMELIADLPEMAEVTELRMVVTSLDALDHVFDCCQTMVDAYCNSSSGGNTMESDGDTSSSTTTQLWQVDRLNLEGIRVRLGDGQFFMLRKSLHDPIISLQIEAHSVEEARERMVQPLYRLLRQVAQIKDYVALGVLDKY